MDEHLTQALLDDKDGLQVVEPPVLERRDGECVDRNNTFVRQILSIFYEEVFQTKNKKLINNALIIPVLQQVVIHLRPFVLVLSSLFLLMIIMTTVVLVIVILK